MRYVIETNKVEVTNTIRSWKAKGVVDIVEQGDLREAMNEKLLIIKEAFFTIRKAGLNLANNPYQKGHFFMIMVNNKGNIKVM